MCVWTSQPVDNNVLIRSGEARLAGWSRQMLYSGFTTLPRSVFWSANLNGRSDNTDVMSLARTQIMNQEPAIIRPRFSLLTFLLCATVICLGISHWNTTRELASAQDELRVLRDEQGHLSIDDESKFHAVAIESPEPNTWRWRMFVPKGNRYKWNIACEKIPKNSPPSKAGVAGFSQEPYWETNNTVLVTARLFELEDGNWMLKVTSKIGGRSKDSGRESKNQMSGATLKIPRDKIEWMSKTSSTDGRVIGSRGTVVRDPSGPIILLQQRPLEKQPDGRYRSSENPMPGFMVWLSKQ